MGKIFISYSSKNRKIADSLCDYLEQQGLPCWIAPRDIPSASNYAGEITRAIKSCDRFLLVYSKDAGRSEHVKNEINLAINNVKSILPYCLDDSPYDDDLEYYLSTKQRIATCGDQDRDFQCIASVLLGGAAVPARKTPGQEAPKGGGTRRSYLPYVLGGLAVAAVCVWLFLLKPGRTDGPEGPGSPVDSLLAGTVHHGTDIRRDSVPAPQVPAGTTGIAATADETKNQGTVKVEQKKEEPKKPAPGNESADTFTGTIRNGYPDGYGTYTFKQSRRIDMHDPEKRVAQKGDYIVGDWNNGHLNFGEWYSASGEKKGFIELGDNADYKADQTFAKCVKP